MWHQSRTEQLILRNNYLRHKRKLEEIKTHPLNTSLNFQIQLPNADKNIDLKKIFNLNAKKQQIQIENQEILNKMSNNLKNQKDVKDSNRVSMISQQNRRTSYSVVNNHRDRYGEEQTKSQFQDEKGEKLFVSSNQKKAGKSFYVSRSKAKGRNYEDVLMSLRQMQQKLTNQTKETPSFSLGQFGQNPQSSQKGQITGQNSRIRQVIRQSWGNNKQTIYNEPEKQSHRVILFKKTKIIQPMLGYLIEISLISDRMLIIAYATGFATEDYKYLISKKHTAQLISKIQGNYQILFQKILIQPGVGIKIIDPPTQEQNSQDLSTNEQEKRNNQIRYEITQDFLQRNYYLQMKILQKNKQEQNKEEKKQKIVFRIKKDHKTEQSDQKNKKGYLQGLKREPKSNIKMQENKKKQNFVRRSIHSSEGQILGILKNQKKVKREQKNEVKLLQNRKDISQSKNKNQIKIQQKNQSQNSLKKNSSNIIKKGEAQFKKAKQEQYSKPSQIAEVSVQQTPNKNESQISYQIPNESIAKTNEQPESHVYTQQFQNNQQQQQQDAEYIQDFEKNPSNSLKKNKSMSIKAVKKEPIHMKNSSIVESMENYVVEEENKNQDIVDEYLDEDFS